VNNQHFKIHCIDLIVKYKGQIIKLFFIRYRGQTKWRIIICSNTKLSFSKMLEIYQIRWSIEFFFKEMKQYLGLEKCQSKDFDAHVAHTTLAITSR
jgi:IS4 transposase